MKELWKPVVGYEDIYEVSNLGKVRSIDREITCVSRWGKEVTRKKRGRVLVGSTHSFGYPSVSLWRDNRGHTKEVHRLVLEAFDGPCADGMECRHLDGDPTNNNVENLKWGTRSENFIDKSKHGNAPRLKPDDVALIRIWLGLGFSRREVAEAFDVCWATIWNIQAGKTWAWLT